jgi:hypothetical protein
MAQLNTPISIGMFDSDITRPSRAGPAARMRAVNVVGSTVRPMPCTARGDKQRNTGSHRAPHRPNVNTRTDHTMSRLAPNLLTAHSDSAIAVTGARA